jgi:hypothetical protein
MDKSEKDERMKRVELKRKEEEARRRCAPMCMCAAFNLCTQAISGSLLSCQGSLT